MVDPLQPGEVPQGRRPRCGTCKRRLKAGADVWLLIDDDQAAHYWCLDCIPAEPIALEPTTTTQLPLF